MQAHCFPSLQDARAREHLGALVWAYSRPCVMHCLSIGIFTPVLRRDARITPHYRLLTWSVLRPPSGRRRGPRGPAAGTLQNPPRPVVPSLPGALQRAAPSADEADPEGPEAHGPGSTESPRRRLRPPDPRTSGVGREPEPRQSRAAGKKTWVGRWVGGPWILHLLNWRLRRSCIRGAKSGLAVLLCCQSPVACALVCMHTATEFTLFDAFGRRRRVADAHEREPKGHNVHRAARRQMVTAGGQL